MLRHARQAGEHSLFPATGAFAPTMANVENSDRSAAATQYNRVPECRRQEQARRIEFSTRG
jgi:hypothetical protein